MSILLAPYMSQTGFDETSCKKGFSHCYSGSSDYGSIDFSKSWGNFSLEILALLPYTRGKD